MTPNSKQSKNYGYIWYKLNKPSFKMIWKILQIGAPQKMGYCIKVQCCRNEKQKKDFHKKKKNGEKPCRSVRILIVSSSRSELQQIFFNNNNKKGHCDVEIRKYKRSCSSSRGETRRFFPFFQPSPAWRRRSQDMWSLLWTSIVDHWPDKKNKKKGPLKKNKTQRTNFNSPNSHNFSNLNWIENNISLFKFLKVEFWCSEKFCGILTYFTPGCLNVT